MGIGTIASVWFPILYGVQGSKAGVYCFVVGYVIHGSFSADYQVTDSAAGGTALATGYKTNNGVVGQNADSTENYQTLLELAAEKEKSTGIISTKWVSDATPASFTVHSTDRSALAQNAGLQLERIADGTLDVVLGGGSAKYENSDNKEVFQKALDSGMTYTTKWEEAQDAKAPLVGLFSGDNMETYRDDVPTLAEMTNLALDVLSQDENGFFLMVEGAQIDTFGHSNELAKQAREVYYLDQAVAVAMRFVAMNPDTVLIVTADHETGGVQIPDKDVWEGELAGEYTSESHTWTNPPVYALGYKTEQLDTIKENVDIAIFIAGLMGDDNFGKPSIVHTILDNSDRVQMAYFVKNNENAENGKKFSTLIFNQDDCDVEIPLEQLEFDVSTLENVRSIHLTIKNCNEEKIAAPSVKYETKNDGWRVLTDPYTYVEPGETKQITYVLSENYWKDNECSTMKKLVIAYDEIATTINMELYNVQITERSPGK